MSPLSCASRVGTNAYVQTCCQIPLQASSFDGIERHAWASNGPVQVPEHPGSRETLQHETGVARQLKTLPLREEHCQPPDEVTHCVLELCCFSFFTVKDAGEEEALV